MRLFHRRRPTETTAPVVPSEEAKEAYEASEGRLNEAKGLWPEVRALVGSLQEARQDNHFEFRIKATLTGGHQ